MKNLFKTPEIEIINLNSVDVVYTSGEFGEDSGNAWGDPEE